MQLLKFVLISTNTFNPAVIIVESSNVIKGHKRVFSYLKKGVLNKYIELTLWHQAFVTKLRI